MASILAVDDSISMRQMLTITLCNAGHDVVAVADGFAALELAASNRFDLVLTDLLMPDMDGLRLIRELRDLPAFENTPLFVLTIETASERKKAGREAGASGWIEKPVSEQHLPVLVEALLQREGR